MTRLLPALHEGHAPVHLHHAFEDALEAFESWKPGRAEPFVAIDGQQVAISAVFGRMRTCSDILPLRLLELARDVAGDDVAPVEDFHVTYAQVALMLRALCVERLRAEAL